MMDDGSKDRRTVEGREGQVDERKQTRRISAFITSLGLVSTFCLAHPCAHGSSIPFLSCDIQMTSSHVTDLQEFSQKGTSTKPHVDENFLKCGA